MGVREVTKNAKIAKVRLGDVCSINMGQSPDSKSYNSEARGLPFYQGNADFGDDHPTPRVWCDTPTKVAEVGEILISVRAPIGALNFANERCCIGRGLASLNPSSEIIPRYLYYSLRSKNEELNLRGTGSTFKAINKKSLATVEFFLPPLPEQKRIAEKLDQICELKKNAEERLALMDQLVKSRFVELFGDEKNYAKVRVDEVFSVGGPKRIHKEEWTSEGIPFLKISDLMNRLENGSRAADCYISKARYDELKAANQVPKAGDVLVTARGTLGRCYVVGVDDEFYFQDGMITWLSNKRDNIDLTYFLEAVQMPEFKRQYEGRSAGTTVAYLTIGQLAKFQLPLPPIGEQRKFAAFVAEVDKSKFVLRETVARMETLYKAKLQEYFG